MAGCEHWAFHLYDGTLCGSEAFAVVVVGCQHEHITSELTCSGCLALLEADKMCCVACHDADGHECAVAVLKVEELTNSINL